MVSAHSVESPYSVPLVIGAHNIPIGFVKVWNDNESLYVLFEIDTDSYPDYAMCESHLYPSSTPLSWSAPGLWPYSNAYSPCATSDLYVIPLSSIGVSPGDTVYLMAHATIYEKGVHVGSAYGYSFKGSFNYTVQEKPAEKPVLSIVKTGPLKAYPGGTYLYTIVVYNAGTLPVYNVNVSDKLPDGVRPAHPEAPGTPTGVYDESKNMVNWTLGTIAVNDFVIINLEVVLDESLAPGTILKNNASAVGLGADEVSAQWSTTVIAGPELVVEKVGPVKGYPGGLLSYTIRVSNVGNETAYNVTVIDAMNLALVEYVTSTPIGTSTDNEVMWDLGTMLKGEERLIYLAVRVRSDVPNGTVIDDVVQAKWMDDAGRSYESEPYHWVTTIYSNPLLNITKLGSLEARPAGRIRHIDR